MSEVDMQVQVAALTDNLQIQVDEGKSTIDQAKRAGQNTIERWRSGEFGNLNVPDLGKIRRGSFGATLMAGLRSLIPGS